MKRIILLPLLVAVPVICSAEIYKWVDEKGQVGFADDLGKVPLKYREKAQSTEKVEQPVEIVEKTEQDKKGAKAAGAKQEQPAAAEEKQAPAKAKPLYAGKGGEAWKRDLDRQKFEVKNLEEQAAGIRERMANPGKLSRGEYLSLQNTSRDLDVRISTAQKKLQTLNDAADRADVPAEFR